ncbi:hypothetical protein L5515_008805 [Caenorhabditis briggsae]|uniref:MADF domain-containing protein n=1 Tax=Caenorhabditis briggsae TaxID=6238 RepID=A0AAE9JMX1_CAEBR|nr:hypothetical protein L5515_008805 [Caenorhabditis briggsae]
MFASSSSNEATVTHYPSQPKSCQLYTPPHKAVVLRRKEALSCRYVSAGSHCTMNELTRELSPNQDPLEDPFLLSLIETVEKNSCVYNRYDPLHKISEYKHQIWRMIGVEIDYDGQPVELERKWKHMRDKYVRLRKQDKQKAPIKPTNKWFAFYHKMSFLDPYVEHRNRKRQKDFIGNNSPEFVDEEGFYIDESKAEVLVPKDVGYCSSSSSSGEKKESSVEPPDLLDDSKVENLAAFYDRLIGNNNGNAVAKQLAVEPVAEQPSRARKRKNAPVQIRPASPSPPPAKKNEEDSVQEQISAILYDVSKSLIKMNSQQLATTRIEISKILNNIESGKNQHS